MRQESILLSESQLNTYFLKANKKLETDSMTIIFSKEYFKFKRNKLHLPVLGYSNIKFKDVTCDWVAVTITKEDANIYLGFDNPYDHTCGTPYAYLIKNKHKSLYDSFVYFLKKTEYFE